MANSTNKTGESPVRRSGRLSRGGIDNRKASIRGDGDGPDTKQPKESSISVKNPLQKKQDLEVSTCTPPACTKCGCTDRTNKQAVVRRNIAGTTREGFAYTQIAWSYVNCLQCDNRYRIIEYLKPAEQK